MGIGDGTVVGTTKILDHGSPADRWNLVLVGDGYTAAQLAAYHTDAQNFVNTLVATPPFSSLTLGGALSRAINVYRVDVTSTDTGADDPVACGGTGAAAATYFDASFCNGGIRRLLGVNNATVLNVVGAQVPQWHMAMALVNSTVYGGSGGSVATFSMAAGASEIGLHEMGHTAFGLADEYEYWAGCGTDVGHDNHPAADPAEPNVTTNTNRATLKWRDLVAATTAIPTTQNANCAQCDPQPSPVPAGTVGEFEGAHYYHCGCYRPEFTCRMRALNNPFCAVCQQRIRATLAPFLPQWRLDWLINLRLILDPRYRLRHLRDWIVDPSPEDLARLRRIAESGMGDAGVGPDELSELLTHVEELDGVAAQSLLHRVNAGITRLEVARELIRGQLQRLGGGR